MDILKVQTRKKTHHHNVYMMVLCYMKIYRQTKNKTGYLITRKKNKQNKKT